MIVSINLEVRGDVAQPAVGLALGVCLTFADCRALMAGEEVYVDPDVSSLDFGLRITAMRDDKTMRDTMVNANPQAIQVGMPKD